MLWREAELHATARLRERNMPNTGPRRWGSMMMASLILAAGLVLPGAARAAENAPAGRYADLPGVKLWFTDTGGTGTPIVLLHANTGTSTSWEPQTAAFVREGYRVIAFDRRGWGKSIADPAGPQPGSVAGDLDALADHLKLDKFHLVGVAGGGFVSLDYAAWRPERLRSLVVAASTGQFSEKEMQDFTAQITIPEQRKQAAVYREVGPSLPRRQPGGHQARWIEIEEHAQQPGAPSQPLRTVYTYAKLATVTMPILVMAADADLLAPPAMMRTWAVHLKGYEWATVPDSGHAIAWEHPDVFNERVLGFIKRH